MADHDEPVPFSAPPGQPATHEERAVQFREWQDMPARIVLLEGLLRDMLGACDDLRGAEAIGPAIPRAWRSLYDAVMATVERARAALTEKGEG